MMITKEAADSHIRCLLRNKIGENMYEYTYNGYNIELMKMEKLGLR